jgi:hypothetical protein
MKNRIRASIIEFNARINLIRKNWNDMTTRCDRSFDTKAIGRKSRSESHVWKYRNSWPINQYVRIKQAADSEPPALYYTLFSFVACHHPFLAYFLRYQTVLERHSIAENLEPYLSRPPARANLCTLKTLSRLTTSIARQNTIEDLPTRLTSAIIDHHWLHVWI